MKKHGNAKSQQQNEKEKKLQPAATACKKDIYFWGIEQLASFGPKIMPV
jgi:hypothetical protein